MDLPDQLWFFLLLMQDVIKQFLLIPSIHELVLFDQLLPVMDFRDLFFNTKDQVNWKAERYIGVLCIHC